MDNKFNFCEHYSEQLWTTAKRGNTSQWLNTIDGITVFLFSSLSGESMIYVGTSINSGSESCKIPFTWLNVEGIFITVPWRGCRKSRCDAMLKRSINAARDCCWFEEVSKEDEDITCIDIHVPYYKLNIYINNTCLKLSFLFICENL